MISQKETDEPAPQPEPHESSGAGATDGDSRPANATTAENSSSSGTEKTEDVKTERGGTAASRPANYKWVGSRVRSMYDDVLNEPIPDSFMDLLRQAYEGKKTPDKS